jgi:hypothetical protein
MYGKRLRHALDTERALLSCALCCVLLTPWAFPPAQAQGFDRDPFGIRFDAALSRFSTYGDVTGVGGVSVAAPFASSGNPAGAAMQDRGERSHSLSPQLVNIGFDSGTDFAVRILSYSWNVTERDRVEFSAVDAASNEQPLPSLAGAAFDFESRQFTAGWSRRLNADLAMGLDVGVSFPEAGLRRNGLDLTRTDSLSYSVAAGLMQRLNAHWLWGVSAGYGSSDNLTRSLVPVPGQALPLLLRHESESSQFLLRTGVSYYFAGRGYWLADYQYGRFRADGDELEVHRLYSGVGFKLLNWLHLRVGGNLDDRGNRVVAAGIGLKPLDGLSMEIAWQGDTFPELQRDFGGSDLVNVSVSLNF